MLNLLTRWWLGIPKYKKNIWYNRSLHVGENPGYPLIFDEKGKYIPCKVGNIVLMGTTKEGNYEIYYKIIKFWKTPGSDWLYPSDSINCDMKFFCITKKYK